MQPIEELGVLVRDFIDFQVVGQLLVEVVGGAVNGFEVLQHHFHSAHQRVGPGGRVQLPNLPDIADNVHFIKLIEARGIDAADPKLPNAGGGLNEVKQRLVAHHKAELVGHFARHQHVVAGGRIGEADELTGRHVFTHRRRAIGFGNAL